jgi:hypothetical protein
LWAAWVLSGDPGDLPDPSVKPSTGESVPPPAIAYAPERRWLIYTGGGALGGLVVLLIGWRLVRSLRLAGRKRRSAE